MIKYFDDQKGYGFIVFDYNDQLEIFFHVDDIVNFNSLSSEQKAEQTEYMKSFRTSQIRVSFTDKNYFGKYKDSKKAAEIRFL